MNLPDMLCQQTFLKDSRSFTIQIIQRNLSNLLHLTARTRQILKMFTHIPYHTMENVYAHTIHVGAIIIIAHTQFLISVPISLKKD